MEPAVRVDVDGCRIALRAAVWKTAMVMPSLNYHFFFMMPLSVRGDGYVAPGDARQGNIAGL